MSAIPSVRVDGPVHRGQRPYGAPAHEVLDAHGYVCEEFRLEGEAIAYTHAGDGEVSPDGRWEPAMYGEAPYRTRLLVLRPADPARFNGTVLLNWQNVSAGFEQDAPVGGEAYRGYAWVGVSAQEAGLYGVMGGHASSRGAPLLDADPERYHDLVYPGEAACFEIFAGAAAAVGPGRSGDGGDPLGGLAVERVVALGGSQSAMRLCAYANGLHRHHEVIDGYVLAVWEGRAPRLEEGPMAMYQRTTIRADLAVPVMVVNSEFEVTATYGLDLDDHDRRRIWEVTGAAHGASTRELPPGRNGWSPNTLRWQPVYEAAIRATDRWLRHGAPPPIQPRIVMEPGNRPAVARDEHGNGLGGIRLPEIAVPIAEYRGRQGGTGRGPVYGGRRPFSDDVIRQLYSSREEYAQRWRHVVDDLVGRGTLLAEDAAAISARGDEIAASLPLGG